MDTRKYNPKESIKLFTLTLVISMVPALQAMEAPLSAETIVNHPKYIILKQRLEEIGGKIKAQPDGIKIDIKFRTGGSSAHICYVEPDIWENAEKLLMHWITFKNGPWELEKTLLETFQGQCILNIGHRYLHGDQLAIEQTEQLPEDLKTLVLKIARKIQ